MSTTPAISCSAVSMTPANHPCHGDNDIGDKFIAGDNDTGEQFSPVTMTPAKNLLLVTRTGMPWRWGAAKEKVERGKSVTSPAADGVIGTSMKPCIHRHSTHPDQRPLRPPKLNIAVLV